ncbi:MAG: transcription-repair coupling factor (superfamily II helicase) [Parcubacteria group bacterium Gr01-1014_33]|nr:MAG: transcription-repair coupling factor (superfamily II helicase) [Parcubacteria group bacterium Gr01-1014_33]
MDRLLVGDVGFGKTEIALRAAFRVVTSGKQAALLAPTTVLTAQHLATFTERFHTLPVRVRMLSRLLSGKEEKEVLQELADGTIDMVVGTHRLLSKDIVFKNLGLVIIDEEQRFGVKQKEKLKSLRTEVDVLSLSATPIPRTMQFVLSKLRDVSLLETPPPERIPIQTLVLPYSQKLIREAIQSELERGGQVYFLHNRIETIGRVKERLEKILRQRKINPPPAKRLAIVRASPLERGRVRVGVPRIGIIHGRMPEKELIRTMEAFRKKEIDILVATTIIENGLDISSANTLIVDDATRLGLAQAHQLRGRIGRGKTQAFAYFLYKPRHLTEKAQERLSALQEYFELGAGYQLALRDLEIRGAGNILGREQSGAVNKVGLNLYYQMLGEAIEEIKLGQSKE